MNKPSTTVDVVDGMRGVTLHVNLKRAAELQWRIWLAMRLFALGAWVLNCGIEFDRNKDGHDEAD